MDTRSAASLSDPAGALERFSAEHGPEIEHLRRARSHTEERLGEVRGQLSAESIPPDISVAVFGSWARHELTEQSDDDWAVLVRGGNTAGPGVARAVELAQQHLGTGSRKPGAQGIFGGVISCAELADKVGLQEDTNSNLTRRALLLLESVEVAGMAHAAYRRRVLDRYLNYGIKDYRPPRFLLNDIVRYWRTIGVDFEGKHREGGDDDPKWVERNAKLRTSRKVLFAGGLIPILQCHLCERVRNGGLPDTQLSTPPTDRLAAAFGHYGAIDEGVRFFAAYDRWIAILGDAAARRELAGREEDRERDEDAADSVGQTLDNLRAAVRRSRWTTLVADLRAAPEDLALEAFLDRHGHRLEDIYRGGSWTRLKRDAAHAAPNAADGDFEKRTLRALSRLTHVDDPERVAYYREVLASDHPPAPDGLDERQRRLLTMLAWGLDSE